MIDIVMERFEEIVDASNDDMFSSLIPEANYDNNLTINELGKKLLIAAQDGNIEDLRGLLNKGAPFTADWLGTSPLHLAAQHNHLEICEIFLRAGMSKDTRTKVERTPLHLAVYEGHMKIAECLLKHGADPDAKDLLHMTPLHWAVQKGFADLVALLIRNGANANIMNKFDLRPTDIAIQMGRTDIIEVIASTAMDPLSNNMIGSIEAKSAVEPILEDQEEEEEEEEPPMLTQQALPIETVLLDDSADILFQQDAVQAHSSIKTLKSSKNAAYNDPIKLLQEHGITMLPDDESNLLKSVMETGHTVVLTEAGKQALHSIKSEKLGHATPTTMAKLKAGQVPHKRKKIITVTADQFLAMTSNGNAPMRILNGKLVQNKFVPLKHNMAQKRRVEPVMEYKQSPVHKTTSAPEEIHDVELLLLQLSKAQSMAENYKQRLIKTEFELQKYKNKCRVLMSKNSLNL